MEKYYINNIRFRPQVAVKTWTAADCQNCYARIIDGLKETIRAERATIKKMLITENDLRERLEKLETELIKAQGNNEELKKINNAFRSIGFAENPTGYDENASIFIASHQTSWNEWGIDTRIKALSYHQKMTEFFAVSIQKSRSKEEVKIRVKELSNEATKKAVEDPISRKESWKAFDKVVLGQAKGAKCSVKDAYAMLLMFGAKVPDGYTLPEGK